MVLDDQALVLGVQVHLEQLAARAIAERAADADATDEAANAAQTAAFDEKVVSPLWPVSTHHPCSSS